LLSTVTETGELIIGVNVIAVYELVGLPNPARRSGTNVDIAKSLPVKFVDLLPNYPTYNY
jgi:hypothetical protein